MEKPYKKRLGDRRDARWVREATSLQVIMGHLFPHRTECEVYLSDKFDATELIRYIEHKNEEHPDYKTTAFHCIIMILAKMVNERPVMNRYVSGRRLYERFETSISFICKRRFTDHAEEALMTLIPKDTDTLDTVSKKIVGDVREARKTEKASGGIDTWIARFAKIPRIILIPIFGIIRFCDFWGLMPAELTRGDTNYSTILVSNLGSIKCPSIYHHLNNYGTNSIVITIGTIHKEEIILEDGTKAIRDIVDIGATLDERIGDGFYFARSLKLVKYMFSHPELLDNPVSAPSGFDYK